MGDKKTRKRKTAAALVLLCLAAVFITVNVSAGWDLKPGQKGFISVFYYPQKVLTVSLRSARDFSRGVFGSRLLAAENRELEMRIRVLEERISELERHSRENEDLRRLLGLREKTDILTALDRGLGAEVIGRNPLNWYRTVTVDRGETDGVRESMVAVSGAGLVGRVVETGGRASSVMLILDTNSKVSVMIDRTGEHGIISGRGDGVLSMQYLPEDTEAEAGDVVRTSGLGGIFPKGILVGKVSGIHKQEHGLTVSAEVAPAVDFSRLETVLILRN